MKKFFLAVLVVSISFVSLSCGSDDGGSDGDNGGNQEQLMVSIDGLQLTFNSIDVDRQNFGGGTSELSITATMSGSTSRIITFYIYVGDTGANAVQNFAYTFNGVYYGAFGGPGTNFVSVTEVNNGSRLEVNFSGTLGGYDEVNQEEVFVTIENGTVRLDL